MRYASPIVASFEGIRKGKSLSLPASPWRNLENHLRSNHFYFVTQTFPIRCHKRLELHNIGPSRWRRSIYWKSNKFLTQIWRILSLSALMLLVKIKRLHRRYCSPFTVVDGFVGQSRRRKLWNYMNWSGRLSNKEKFIAKSLIQFSNNFLLLLFCCGFSTELRRDNKTCQGVHVNPF